MVEAETLERVQHGFPAGVSGAVQAGPKGEVLGHGQHRLHGVQMADIMEPPAMGLGIFGNRFAAPGEAAAGRP